MTGSGMSEDEVWNALEKLYRDGDIDHVPGIGSDVDPAFSLTDSGTDRAEQLLRENDDAVLFLVGVTAQNAFDSNENIAEHLVKMADQMSESAGVNLFRVLQRHDDKVDWLDAADLPVEFVEEFDP